VSDDDDWFERALSEDEREASDDEADVGGASESDATPDDGRSSDAESDEIGSDDAGSDDAMPDDGEAFAGVDDPAEEAHRDAEESRTDPDPEPDSSPAGFAGAEPYDAGGDGSAGGGDDGDDLFDEGFASAFENAPGGGPGGSTPADGEDAAGGFGGGSAGGFDDVGDVGDSGGEFGAEAEGFGGGFGDPDDSFEDDFDDEEFESSIPRIDVGIEGLDSMVQGGVPERSLMTTIGSAGTGKTTFGLQFLHEALRQGENAVFITLEESKDRIVDTATEKGWAFDEYVDEGSLAVIDLDPIEMANSLTSIRNDLPRLVEEFGATRLVLDSVSLLEMMYDDQATRRNEVYDFTKSLKEAGVTTMLTSEASQETPYASRHGIIEYLVDAVFVLQYIRGSDDFRETRLAVEIQKIRDANHSREIKPYAITDEGISVYRQANIF